MNDAVTSAVTEAEYVITRLGWQPRGVNELHEMMATPAARILVSEFRMKRLWRSLPWWFRAWLRVTGFLLPRLRHE